ncbi:AAA family ATPase [Streptomyces sp. NPDC005474]|uniref:AAA family ATPase n=1 Tax=Streptomyces sp. NPDC005474 TaxID=3154878 RepID=UPI00345504F5
MGEVATAVSDEAFAALAENLGYILETRALLCVIAPPDVQGVAVVEAALSRCDGADAVVVTTAAPGSLAALLDAFHAALHLGVRPRRLADAQQAVENELARRSWPVVVVRDAHLLRTEALLYVYGLWSLFQERERRMPVVLVGPERIRSVLRRPSLASLESCVFIWHRLTAADGNRLRRAT